MEKVFIVYAKIDRHEYVEGIFKGTEYEVENYCKAKTFEEECEAYGGDDDDFDEPYPYVTTYSYKETTFLN